MNSEAEHKNGLPYIKENVYVLGYSFKNLLIIGGPNTNVEIDESLFTRRKNKQGIVLPQQWVFEGICRELEISSKFAISNSRYLELFARSPESSR